MSDSLKVKERIHYARLDALRFYAVAAVLLSHYLPTGLTRHLFAGTAGVELFFVISGFLITDILFGYRMSGPDTLRHLGRFYARRTLRIFPIYYLYLVVVALTIPTVTWEELRWAFAYVYNLYEMSNTASRPLLHLWSLSIEEQFYLIWPLVILKTPMRRVFHVMLGLILFSILFRVVVPGVPHKLSTISCFDAFGLGGVFAWLRRYDPGTLRRLLGMRWTLWLALIWLTGTILTSFTAWTLPDAGFRSAIAVISFHLLGACVPSDGRVLKESSRWLDGRRRQYLGVISYGIYLFHLLPMLWMEGWLERILRPLSDAGIASLIYYNRYIIGAPLYAIFTVILAMLSHRYIERYFTRFKDRRFS
jgi:peptidoglycan/LPS O-acetylase OafA/YrhL